MKTMTNEDLSTVFGGSAGVDAFCEHPFIYGGAAGAVATGGQVWGALVGAGLAAGYCDDYQNAKKRNGER